MIESGGGNEEIVVVRIERGSSGPIWLFSERTLSLVPTLYEEITLRWTERILPRFLTARRIEAYGSSSGSPFSWACCSSTSTALLELVLTPLIRGSWPDFPPVRPVRRQRPSRAGSPPAPGVRDSLGPGYAAAVASAMVWSNAASLINVAAVGAAGSPERRIEQFIRRRFRANVSAGASLFACCAGCSTCS